MSKTTKLATSVVGLEYGQVAGRNYDNVHVVIEMAAQKIKVHVTEMWGQNNGYHEEYGRKSVVASARELADAINEAQEKANAKGIKSEYSVQALSQAHFEALSEEKKLVAVVKEGADLEHVPGNSYRDVKVRIYKVGNAVAVCVSQINGDCHDHDEAKKVFGISTSMDTAINQAEALAKIAEIRKEYITPALMKALTEAKATN